MMFKSGLYECTRFRIQSYTRSRRKTGILANFKQTNKTITTNKIHLPSPTACLIPRVVLGKGTLKVTHFDVVRSVFRRKDYVNRHQLFVLSKILGKCSIYD